MILCFAQFQFSQLVEHKLGYFKKCCIISCQIDLLCVFFEYLRIREKLHGNKAYKLLRQVEIWILIEVIRDLRNRWKHKHEKILCREICVGFWWILFDTIKSTFIAFFKVFNILIWKSWVLITLTEKKFNHSWKILSRFQNSFKVFNHKKFHCGNLITFVAFNEKNNNFSLQLDCSYFRNQRIYFDIQQVTRFYNDE